MDTVYFYEVLLGCDFFWINVISQKSCPQVGWMRDVNLSIKKFCHPQLLYDWCCGNKKQKQKHFPGVSWQSFHYTIMTIKSCLEMLHRTKSIIFSKEWEVTVVNLSEQILIEKKITSLSYKTWKIMILIIIIFFQCHLLVNLAWYIFPQIRFETKRWISVFLWLCPYSFANIHSYYYYYYTCYHHHHHHHYSYYFTNWLRQITHYRHS